MIRMGVRVEHVADGQSVARGDGAVAVDQADFRIDEDAAKQKALRADEARIIHKMIAAKNKGAETQRPNGGARRPRYTCDTIEDDAYIVADDYNGMQTKNTDDQSRNQK